MTDTDAGAAGRAAVDRDSVGNIDRSPTYLSSVLAVLAGVFTVVTTVYAPLPVGVGLAGLLAFALGLVAGRQSLVTAGGGLLAAAVVVAGLAGAPVSATLVGTMTALLAYDLGTTALGLGEQLGREAPAVEVELLHAGVSTAVGLGVVVLGLVVHEVATGGQPVSALLGLVIVALVLVATLRRADPVPGRGA